MRSTKSLIYFVVVVSLFGCQRSNAVKQQPLRGSVWVNDLPSPGIMVTFHRSDSGSNGNMAASSTVTDHLGGFAIPASSGQEALSPGKYVVTFQWLKRDGSVDFLRNRYDNAKTSKHAVQIDSTTAELEAFELEATTEDMMAAIADYEAGPRDKATRVP